MENVLTLEEVTPILLWTGVWMFLTFIVAPVLWSTLPVTSEIYKSLKWERKYDWNIRTGSIVSAFLATFFALQNIRLHLSESEAHQNSPEGVLPLQFMMGFFITDFIAIIYNRNYYGKKSVIEYVGHHVVSLVGFYLSVRYKVLLWYANYRLLSEFSTPLINGRFFLQELGMRDSTLYATNRICTMLAFGLCRICTIPKFWMATYANYDMIMGCDSAIIFVLFASGILLDTLNVTWFFFIMKVVISELRKIPEMAKEQSNLIRQKIILKKDTMMKSFKDAKGEMKNQMFVKMDHLKDGMMHKMDNVRRRLNNSLRRQ